MFRLFYVVCGSFLSFLTFNKRVGESPCQCNYIYMLQGMKSKPNSVLLVWGRVGGWGWGGGGGGGWRGWGDGGIGSLLVAGFVFYELLWFSWIFFENSYVASLGTPIFSLRCRMDGLPEPRSLVKSGEDLPKEPSVPPTRDQDLQNRSAALVDHGLSVMSYSSPSSVHPSGAVHGPNATLVQDSQPSQDSSGDSLPPPPCPAEPCESFLRKTGRSQLSSLDSVLWLCRTS